MTRRHQILLGISLLVIMVNLMVQLTVIRKAEEVLERQRQSVTRQARSAVLQKKGPDAERYTLMRRARDTQRMIEMRMPHVFDLPVLADAIARGIERSGLTLKASMVFRSGPAEITGVNRYETRIRLSGSYPALKQFLAHLQNLPELLVMEEVRFSRPEEDRSQVELTVDLALFLKGNVNG